MSEEQKDPGTPEEKPVVKVTDQAEEPKANTEEVKIEDPQNPIGSEDLPLEKKSEFPEQVPGEFDWDAVDKKQELYSETERKRMEDMYAETLKSIGEGEVIDGTVVSMNAREIVVNIGFKSDGVIPAAELRYNQNLKHGDTIEVYVESQEDSTGQLVLSHKKARTLRSWERINAAKDNDEIIQGFVKCRTKGGLIVDVFGIEAFLPGSQIDVKPIRDYDIYVGKTMDFKVVKINHEYKNVVVSHKALIEAELEIQKAEIIAKLEKGQILEGTVKNITSYGVFVDLGGVDGLVHITDLSWGRINHPEEIVKLDEKINVVILDFDENKKRIALGLKQLTPHPWDSLDPNLKVGDQVKGKVVVIADYGAFIEIASGVEGLIHVSEMSWSQHLRTAQDFLKVGDEVEAVILTLDREDRKMSLGIKQLIPDPWENIHEKYALGTKTTATVRNFTNFGIFVELEEGVDGLIHISDLSWSKKIKHPAEFTKIGESIEVVVLDVDKENRRLSLGHKQLEENPWEVFESVFTIDSVHQGTIVGTSDKGVIVALPYGVEGFAPTRHIVKEDGTTAKMDETLDFKVIEFNKESKKIVVSHTKVYQDLKYAERASESSDRKAKEKDTRKTVKKMKDSLEKTTLGDIDALANLKSEIEKTEQSALSAKKEEAIRKLEAKATEEKKKKEEASVEDAKKESAKEEKVDAEKAEVAEEKPVKKASKKEEAAEKDEKEDAAKEEKVDAEKAEVAEEKPAKKASKKEEAPVKDEKKESAKEKTVDAGEEVSAETPKTTKAKKAEADKEADALPAVEKEEEPKAKKAPSKKKTTKAAAKKKEDDVPPEDTVEKAAGEDDKEEKPSDEEKDA
ncbi:MAG: 30S ribosomal protein S1 [Bacteroidia bacterium]|nr:MAG: 30S ribosomal protein S1 [Bacteroidia bacterium]